jgi:hypothetical protein
MKKYLLTFLFLFPVSVFANTLTPTTIYSNTIVNCNLDINGQFAIYSVDTGSLRASEGCAVPTGDLSTVWGGDGVDFFPLTNYHILVLDIIAIDPNCYTSYDLCLLTSSVVADLGVYSFYNSLSPVVSGLFSFKNPDTNLPSNNPIDLLASVGIVSTDTFESALPYMLVFIGIPLAFYIIQALKNFMPKDKKDSKKIYDIVPEVSAGVVHTTFKERKKDL